MAYQRPSLSALRTQASSDVTSNIPGADGLLRRGNLRVLSDILAALINLNYGYLDWIANEDVPFTATDERLEGWAALKGIYREGATAASGNVTFTGVNGTDLPSGSSVVRSDGRSYITTADAVVTGGSVTTPATDNTISATGNYAVGGAAGNCSAGTSFTLGNSISGIQVGGTSSAFTGGADVETNDSLRSRTLKAYQAPPQGGDPDDYIEWATQVNGVTRVWVNPNGFGPGTVVVYIMLDQAESAHNGFPQGNNGVAAAEPRDTPATGDQLTVANYIFPLRPATALVYVVAPIAIAIPFTIKGLNPNTTAMQLLVEGAIDDAFFRLGSASGGTIALADVEAAIEAIPGIKDFIITSPLADIVTTVGYLPILGAITWI